MCTVENILSKPQNPGLKSGGYLTGGVWICDIDLTYSVMTIAYVFDC